MNFLCFGMKLIAESSKTYYLYYDFSSNKVIIDQHGAIRLSVRKTRRRDDSPMPATGAGLIRFYSESDSPGLKIGPYWTVGIAIAFIALIFVLNLLKLNA